MLIANTFYNKIAAWDRWDKTRTAWFNGTVRIADDPETDDHVNSIWYDKKHYYVCEHLFGPSRIRILDFGWNPVNNWQIGNEALNIYVEDGVVYVCDSAHGAVLARDLKTGKETSVCIADKLDWISKPVERFIHIAYTRGLARTENRFYIGCSAFTPRGERIKGQSAVAILDSDLNYIDKIILEDTGGLGDIRVVDGIDRAHNGFYCPWDGTIPNA